MCDEFESGGVWAKTTQGLHIVRDLLMGQWWYWAQVGQSRRGHLHGIVFYVLLNVILRVHNVNFIFLLSAGKFFLIEVLSTF